MWRYCFRYCVLLLTCAAALTACERAPSIDPYAPSVISDWPLPPESDSIKPGLALTQDGRLLLIWLNERPGRRKVVQFSTYNPARQHWLNRTTIAVGNNLDSLMSPRMITSRDGTLWAQWRQSKSIASGAVMVSHSRDGGVSWSVPQVPYDAEHGNRYWDSVSLWPKGESGIGMLLYDSNTWNFIRGANISHLLLTSMYASGQPDVADRLESCGSPDAVMTSRGPLLILPRFIDNEGTVAFVVARRHFDGWSEPVLMFPSYNNFHDSDDVYNIHCNNSLALTAYGDVAVAAWLDQNDDDSRVIRMVRSTDAGETFSDPIEMTGEDGIEQVIVALDAQQVWVLWTQYHTDGTKSLWFARRSADLQEEYERREITQVSLDILHRMDPTFVVSGGIGWLVWTEVHDTSKTLRGVKIQPGMAVASE